MKNYFSTIMLSAESRRRFRRLLIYFLASAILLIAGLGFYYFWASNHATPISVSFSYIGKSPIYNNEYSFSYKRSQTWSANDTGAICAQYDCVITNHSDTDLSNWEIVFPLDEPVKLSGYWNGNYELTDNAITVTPVVYNNVVPAGGSISIGMVLQTPPDFTIAEINFSAKQDKDFTKDPLFGLVFVCAIALLVAYTVGFVFEIRLLSIRARKDRYRNLLVQSLNTISSTIDAKDPYTQGHSKRVAIYSRELAKRLGLAKDAQEDIYYIGLMHDIGKIGIPDNILNKTERLSNAEFDIIRTHTTIGASILQDFTLIPDIASGAKYHHERMDGKGYPSGLSGTDIPYVARIICVADSYDAMTSSRCYRTALSPETVISELKRCSGTQFDPEIVNELLDMIEKKEVPVTLP